MFLFSRDYHENEMYGFAVHRFKVDTFARDSDGKEHLCYTGYLHMGNGDTETDSGTHYLLTFLQGADQLLVVSAESASGEGVGKFLYGEELVSRRYEFDTYFDLT